MSFNRRTPCTFKWTDDLNSKWHPQHTCKCNGAHPLHVCHVTYADYARVKVYCGRTRKNPGKA